MSDTTAAAGFATLAIHAGAQPDLASSSLPPGISAAGDIASDPAVAALEERIATLEGGSAAVATASGPAARALVFRTLMQPGDEVLAARRTGFDAHDPLDATCAAFGWQVRWADADAPTSFVEALSDRTKAILVDSIATDGRVADIEAIATIARRARIPLVVDNSLATPYLARPLEHGADIVLYTSTSLLAGHPGVRCGLVIDGGAFSFDGDPRYPALSQPSRGGPAIAAAYGNFAFAAGARRGACDLGGAPSPLAAYLVAAGIETLNLRLQRQSDSARTVARHLTGHSHVAWVRYAGLERDAGHGLARRICPNGAGALLTFGSADAGALVERLRLFATASKAGGTRSSVSHSDETVFLSIGLEDVSDILADLDQALAE